MRRVSLAGLALVGALVLAIPAAFAKPDAGAQSAPGITASTITIGGTFPLTGPVSSYAPIPAGMKAYFSYINARKGPDGKRGIYGRQIVWKYYDDGYNPANSIQLTRKLVQEDKVFAVVGSLGTEVNDAIRPYLNSARVPHVLVSTGASHFGREYKQYPWTIGWQPDYVAEGRLYGADIRRNHRNAKIAILYQNDSYGKDYVIGFKSALGDANAKRQIVGEEPFDVTSPSPASQIAKLRASGADTLMIFVTTRATFQTYGVIRALNWKPTRIYLNSVTGDRRPHGDGGCLFERRHRQRLDQHRVPEGSGVAEMGERPDRQAVHGADGEVQPARACQRRAELLRLREGAHVRPRDVQGG